jgi:hypothetical protein
VLLQEAHIFRPNLLTDFRLNYMRQNAGRRPASGVPSVADLGVKNIYQTAAMTRPARFTRNNYTLADDRRWTKGRHSLNFGFHGELSRVDLDNQFLRNGTFPSLP